MTPEDTEAQKAAEAEVDAQRLLPDENPESRDPDDAVHWLDVYTQLLQGKAAILTSLTERLAKIPEEAAREELAKTDVVTLDREVKRIQGRIDFWTTRRSELEADPPGESA